MKIDNTIHLKDGRNLGFAEYGKSSGIPLIYFHGGQESRMSSSFMDTIAKEMGIRIIAPDRPGIGLSSFQKDRTFIQWADDVRELNDQLDIKEYFLLALSGGAPHLLSCVHQDASNILGATIVSGATPYNYKGTLKGMWFPVKGLHWMAASKNDGQLKKFIQNDLNELSHSPEKKMKQFQKFLPRPDRDLLTTQPQYGWDFIKGSLESYRQGIDGVVQEWKLYVSPWGFDVQEIRSHIHLWYGNDDKMASKYRGLYYEKMLPNSNLHLVPQQGHFSLIRTQLKEILTELVKL